MGLTLWMMGLADAADYQGNPWAPYDATDPLQPMPPMLAFHSEAAIRAGFASGLPPKTPPLDRLLAGYLDLHCGWGEDLPGALSSERRPFAPPPIAAFEIKALLRHGYLIGDGARVAWTSKVADAMMQIGEWTQDGKHADTEMWAWADRQAELALWMMPDDIRAQVFGSIAPVVACTDLLLAHWTGQGWQAEAAPKRTLFPADIALGKALWARMRPPG